MNSRDSKVIIAAAICILATGALLMRWASIQELGRPGVRIVPEKIAGLDPTATGTNRHFLAGTNSIYLPPRVLDYRSEVQPVLRVVWDWLPKDTTYGQRVYRSPSGFEILNLGVLMGTDRTSIHQPQYCLIASGWRIASSEKASVRIAGPQPYDLPVMKLTTRQNLMNPDGSFREISGVFVYWFVTDGLLTADHVERMWWMARGLLLEGTLQRWAYIICFAPCVPGDEEMTFARLSEFIAASVPEYHLTGSSAPDELAGR
jgi:hypothetical protein